MEFKKHKREDEQSSSLFDHLPHFIFKHLPSHTGEMGDAMASRYWCYMCCQRVSPITEAEVKCPLCEGGFVEEMDSSEDNRSAIALSSERARSLWTSILLGLIDVRSPHRARLATQHTRDRAETENERNLEPSPLRRRTMNSSASVVRFLQDLRSSTMTPELENADGENNGNAIVVNSSSQPRDHDHAQNAAGFVGEYLLGPGMDFFLQRLAESGSNRNGSTPARREAVRGMPTVIIEENLQCAICLEEFEIGGDAKEVACKHKFHDECIVPWLELHSSCPVCRFQMPCDDNKIETSGFRSDRGLIDSTRSSLGRRYWVPTPSPLDNLLPFSGSQSSGTGSSNPSQHAFQGDED